MTPTALLVFGVAVAAAGLYAGWIYRSREVRVSGSRGLSLLRAAILALVVLLLLNPSLPWGASGLEPGAWVLLDRSASMAATSPGGTAAWERAVERAESSVPPDGRLVVWDGRAQVVERLSDDLGPTGSASTLTGAIELAAQAGVANARVITDLRITDLSRALARAEALGVRLHFEDVGEPLRNVGVLDVEAPDRVEPSDTFSIGVAVFGEGGEQDSVAVEVRREGALVGTRGARFPSTGEVERVRVRLPPPGTEQVGQSGVRYTVHVRTDGDGFARDDARSVFVRTGETEGGLVLISDRPDWEIRSLQPVLAQVTGLTTVGWMRVGGDLWQPVRGNANRAAPLEGERVARRAASADVLVVHGLSEDSPSWLTQAVAESGSLLVFPATPGGTDPLGIESRRRAEGEWYALAPPASPVAGQLADARFSTLPPLTSVLSLADEVGRQVLQVRLGAAGATRPAVLLVETDGRRVGLATGAGFWRWALRGGDARHAYRRLWSAVAGWIQEGERVRSAGDVRPQHPVAASDTPLFWVAPGRAGDSLTIQVRDSASLVSDTALVVPPGERFRTAGLAAGVHTFQVRHAGQGVGAGRVDVERWSDELRIGPGAADSVTGSGDRAEGLVAGFRLRTHPLPYLLLMALLTVEWVGRRRRGLR